MHKILSEIYPEDIYQDFVPMPESITGWGGADPIFEMLIRTVKPKVILEVGTWKGQSAITMAEACKISRLDCVIICVDTWLGSEEHILKFRKELNTVNGFPTLYYQFLSNVVHRGVQERIVPLPTTSLTAANVLTQLRIKADLIYIDANHQYEGLMADLKAFSPLLAKGGILFGHDYGWESVQRAVVDFCKATGTGHRSNADFWILQDLVTPVACGFIAAFLSRKARSVWRSISAVPNRLRPRGRIRPGVPVPARRSRGPITATRQFGCFRS